MEKTKIFLDSSKIHRNISEQPPFCLKKNFRITNSRSTIDTFWLHTECPTDSVPLCNSILQFLKLHISKSRTSLKTLSQDLSGATSKKWVIFGCRQKPFLRCHLKDLETRFLNWSYFLKYVVLKIAKLSFKVESKRWDTLNILQIWSFFSILLVSIILYF